MTSLEAGTVAHGSTDQDLIATKRKHVQESDVAQSRSRQIQRDVLEFLQRHDTDPPFLTHDLGADKAESADEPAHKKARLSNPSDTTSTIAGRLGNASYASLEQIKADATRVGQELISGIRARVSDKTQNGGRPSVDELKQIHRIQSFEKLVKDVADKEIRYTSVNEERDVRPKQEPESLTNGHVPGSKAQPTTNRTGTVLTLFGNAPTPKQLFSSMQHVANAKSEPLIKNELIVEEMSLPNGITATSVVAGLEDEAKKGPTLEEAFAPPHALPALQPPKTHKRPSTRDNTITWEFREQVQRNSRKGGYTVQGLTVGDWLNYGGLDPESDPSSPREKRKLRDRALSSGEHMQQPPSKAALEEALAREEEALFRRAFSSFAPSYDNAKALVPEETKNMVWWHKVGNRRFNDTFAIDPALIDEQPVVAADFEPLAEFERKHEDFSHIMEDLDEFASIELEEPDQQPHSKTDVDQVLRDISDLLETLASHQRIRNASLSSAASVSRTPISPSPTLASKVGTPDAPVEDEISTYTSLRRELAYLLLKLPPYAIAKLDGDQLADLAVSKIITLEAKDVKGTLEEDLVSRQAKLAAMATASSIATLTRPSSSAGQHYNTTAQRTPAIGQAANTRYGQSAQYGARTPTVPQYQRPAPANQQYGTPSAPRPGYGQPNQYARSSAPQPGYGPANYQQHYQPRPAQHAPGGYGTYNTQYHQTPQQRPGFPTPPLMQYQQGSHTAARNAIAYQTSNAPQPNSYTRPASPGKPAGYAAPLPQAQTQQQSNYSSQQPQPGSGRGTPNQYTSQTKPPVNGYQLPTSQQRPQQAVAPRPASTTPQPPPIAPPPTQETFSAQVNGHS